MTCPWTRVNEQGNSNHCSKHFHLLDQFFSLRKVQKARFSCLHKSKTKISWENSNNTCSKTSQLKQINNQARRSLNFSRCCVEKQPNSYLLNVKRNREKIMWSFSKSWLISAVLVHYLSVSLTLSHFKNITPKEVKILLQKYYSPSPPSLPPPLLRRRQKQELLFTKKAVWH